jgi:cytochrome d ubiquinol oxidase subunit I
MEANIDYFGYGYIDSREELVSPVNLIDWPFRVMVSLGGFLLLLMGVVLWTERRNRLKDMRWLQWVSLLSIPLVYLAGQAGWIVAEVGRQPWVIEGLLPVKAAVSSVSVGAVQTTFFLFVAVFTLFLVIELRILFKAIKKGPNVEIE